MQRGSFTCLLHSILRRVQSDVTELNLTDTV